MMPHLYRESWCLTTLVSILVLLLCGACSAPKRAIGIPTTADCLETMGPEVTSVVIWRFQTPEISGCREAETWMAAYRGLPNSGSSSDLMTHVYKGVLAAAPVLHVEGGVDFTWPKGFGAGTYRSTSLWVTRDSLSRLQAQIKADPGVQDESSSAQLAIYATDVEVPQSVEPETQPLMERRYLAVCGDRVLLVAERREDIIWAARKLESPSGCLPRRWAGYEHLLEMDASGIVLRDRTAGEFKTGSLESQLWPEPEGENPCISGLGLAVTVEDARTLQLKMLARNPEAEWERFFEAFLFEEGGGVDVVDRVSDRADVIVLRCQAAQDSESPILPSLIPGLWRLFGVRIMI